MPSGKKPLSDTLTRIPSLGHIQQMDCLMFAPHRYWSSYVHFIWRGHTIMSLCIAKPDWHQMKGIHSWHQFESSYILCYHGWYLNVLKVWSKNRYGNLHRKSITFLPKTDPWSYSTAKQAACFLCIYIYREREILTFSVSSQKALLLASIYISR